MNEDWIRWITASCFKYFDTNKGIYTLELSAEHDDSLDLWATFMLTGFTINEPSRNYFKIKCSPFICLTDIPDNLDIYRLQRMVGYFANLFDNIPIFEFGDGDSAIGCLLRKGEIMIKNYGEPLPGTKLLQSTISAEFQMTLQGDS